MRIAIAAAASLLSIAPAHAAVLLNDVTDYNAYFLGNFTGFNSDVEGRLAAGGNVSLNSYGIAQASGVDFGDTYTLVVGGHLAAGNGRTHQGSTLTNTGKISPNFTSNVTYSGSQQPNLDFYSEALRLFGLSSLLGMNAATGTAIAQYGGLTLTGAEGGLNVFNISANDLSNKNNFVLNAPSGSSALINVTGSAAALKNQGFSLNGIDRGNVLFNFIDASDLTLGGIGFQGSILAPKADVKFNNGQINGTLIGKNFTGNGQINYAPYKGGLLSSVGAVPEPATWMMMLLGMGMIGSVLRRGKRGEYRKPLAA